jgi:hypothetical protein
VTLSRHAKQIFDEPYPSITWLRSMTKENLLLALLEMKRSYSGDSMRVKEMEHTLAMAEIDIRKLELQSKLEATNNVIQYGVEIKDHQYGPKAIGNVASIWNGENMNRAVSVKPLSDSDLSGRANLAEEQGIVWNLQNKRPERESTIRKKVEEWEKGLDRGLNADLTVYSIKSAEGIKITGPEYRPFMTGLCMQMEQRLGKGPQHKYLVPRFKNIAKQYRKTFPVVQDLPEVIEPVEDKSRPIIELIYTKWLGEGYKSELRKFDEREGTFSQDQFSSYLDKHADILRNLDPDESIRDRKFASRVLWDTFQRSTYHLVKGRIDWHIPCRRSEELCMFRDVYQEYKKVKESREAYNDMLHAWWIRMCDELGLG